ncbi:MAG: hypothetical protein ACJZ72_00425 [Opitutales bacterium]
MNQKTANQESTLSLDEGKPAGFWERALCRQLKKIDRGYLSLSVGNHTQQMGTVSDGNHFREY